MVAEQTFLESLQNLVNVLVNETRPVHYLVHTVGGEERRKAGSRSQRYTFQCVNCQSTVTKRARAKYCSSRCRKQAERKREQALVFFLDNREALGPTIQTIGAQVLLSRDTSPPDCLKEKQKQP